MIFIQLTAYTVQTSIQRFVQVRDYIEQRALTIGDYIIEAGATVRQAAKKFGISKSTVHKDITERLEEIKPYLAREVREVLDINKAERHIRGGLATKEKYAKIAGEL